MLSGFAIIKTGYFGNIMAISKIKRQCQDNMGVYHFVSRTKTLIYHTHIKSSFPTTSRDLFSLKGFNPHDATKALFCIFEE